jgi:hypothetical protein
MSFNSTILSAPNNLPYFETQLPSELEVTMTNQTNDFKLYINGVLDSTDSVGTYTGGPSGNAYEHTLGTYNRPGAGYEGYANVTYSVYRVYNRVLPAAEILNNYNIQKGRFGY